MLPIDIASAVGKQRFHTVCKNFDAFAEASWFGLAPGSNPAIVLQLQPYGIAAVAFEFSGLLDVRFPGGIGLSVSGDRCAREIEVAVCSRDVAGRRRKSADNHRHHRVGSVLLGRDHQRSNTIGLSGRTVRILHREHVGKDDVKVGILG